MHESSLLVELVLLVAAAAVGVAIFERLRLPSVVGFLLTGALVGPGGLGLVADAEAVLTLAELGVVFLLFEIGLELPVQQLRQRWPEALAAGGLQIAVTLAVTAVAARALGLALPAAVLVGMLVAMSSTALVMRLLSERGELEAPHGQIAVAILLLQDVCVVPFLLAVPLLADPESASLASVAEAVVRALVVLGGLGAIARFVLPVAMEHAARVNSREVFTLAAVLVVAGSAVAAEALGLTLAVGAFLAGLALNSSPYGAQLFAETGPLRGVLLGIFFTAVGMLLDVPAVIADPAPVVLLALASGPIKAVGIALLLALVLRMGVRVAVLAAAAIAQTGEFSFVLARAALDEGLLSEPLAEAFIAGSVLSLVATPLLVRAAPGIAARLAPGGPAGVALRGAPAEGPIRSRRSGHVVLVGYGLTGRTLARILAGVGAQPTAVELNARSVRAARERGEDVVFGDATRPTLLAHLDVARARAVVVAVNDPLATRDIVAAVRALAPGVPILARTRYVAHVDVLAARGADQVVADEVEGTLDLVAGVLRRLGHAEGAIGRFVEELRDEGYGFAREALASGPDPWLLELLEGVATEWIELPPDLPPRTLAELELRPRVGVSVLAVEAAGRTTPNPGPEVRLEGGQRVLVFGDPAAVAAARRLLGVPDAP